MGSEMCIRDSVNSIASANHTCDSQQNLAIDENAIDINTNLNLIRNVNNNISSTRLPVIVMAHLERLVQPFNSHANLAFKKTLKGVTKNISHPNDHVGDLTSRLNNAIPRFAYCIEPSEDSMSYFHAILSKCYNRKNKEDQRRYLYKTWKRCEKYRFLRGTNRIVYTQN